MIALYSFKLSKTHYKPFDFNFFKVAKLSLEMSKKIYGKTKLVTDIKSHLFLKNNGIVFDEVIFLDEILNYKGIYSEKHELSWFNSFISKLYAMIYETEPYIMLDFDTVLLGKLPNKYDIGFAFPEIPSITINTLLVSSHVNNTIEYVTETFKNNYESTKHLLPDNFEIHETSPSNCAVIVNNPIIVSEIVLHIKNLFTDLEYVQLSPAFIEQFLFYNFLKYFKIDCGYILENEPDYINPQSSIEFFNKKMYHFIDYDTNVNTMISVDKIINRFNINI